MNPRWWTLVAVCTATFVLLLARLLAFLGALARALLVRPADFRAAAPSS